MRRGKKTAQLVKDCQKLARLVSDFSTSDVWVDYDREADVVYVSFRRPQHATDTIEMDDQGILLRYRGKKLVGVTILNASTR